MEIRVCPLCGSSRRIDLPRFSRDHWVVSRCSDCDLTYLKNPPGYGALHADFAWEKTYAQEEADRLARSPVLHRADLATRWRHRIARKPLAQRCSAWFGTGNLLNIGCADARQEFPGFRHFGIEISKELAEAANRHLATQGGYCIHGPGAEAIGQFEDDFFDGILMSSYLEHEENPVTVLKSAYRVLKPTGRIYVRVPNFGSIGRRIFVANWVGFRFPDHVNYFTIATLREIADRCGFRLRLLNPVRVPFDDNINALLEPVGKHATRISRAEAPADAQTARKPRVPA